MRHLIRGQRANQTLGTMWVTRSAFTQELRLSEVAPKAGDEGAVLRQLPGTIRSVISDKRVTQYTVCVVEFRTLIHLDHSFFEIRAWLLGVWP